MDMRWERNFREQMKRRREAAGESQSALAKRIAAKGLSFHQPTVQRIETGERPVRLDEAHVIAEVLGVDLDMMTRTADDEMVDASVAQSRLAAYMNGIRRAIDASVSDQDDVSEFTEALSGAVSGGGVGSPTAQWLAAWGVFGLEAMDALVALHRATLRFHPDWEPDWDEPSYEYRYPIDELRHLVDDASWDEIPEPRRPRTVSAEGVEAVQDLLSPRDD